MTALASGLTQQLDALGTAGVIAAGLVWAGAGPLAGWVHEWYLTRRGEPRRPQSMRVVLGTALIGTALASAGVGALAGPVMAGQVGRGGAWATAAWGVLAVVGVLRQAHHSGWVRWGPLAAAVTVAVAGLVGIVAGAAAVLHRLVALPAPAPQAGPATTAIATELTRGYLPVVLGLGAAAGVLALLLLAVVIRWLLRAAVCEPDPGPHRDPEPATAGSPARAASEAAAGR